jgi:non-heme chloroperoxidase
MKHSRMIVAILTIAISACIASRNLYADDKLPNGWKNGFVTATDGVKIHYVEAGRPSIPATVQPTFGGSPGMSVGASASASASYSGHEVLTILFVPGWTMPEWIWDKQIEYFAKGYHVVAMDPRCQGESSQTNAGLFPAGRARDIKAVIDQLHLAPVVIVGWSMAVAEVAAYSDQFGTNGVAGLVLVDGGVGGFGAGDAEADFGILKGVLENRESQADAFVRKICIQKPQQEDYLKRLVAESLKVPTITAVALLVGYFSADYRSTLPKIDRPTLIVAAKSAYSDSVTGLQQQIRGSQVEVFDDVGHALFVDDPDHFNSVLLSFLEHSISPKAH